MTWAAIGDWHLSWHGAAGSADVEPEAPPLGEVACERGRWYAALPGEVVYDGDAWQVETFDTRDEAVDALASKLGSDLPACPGEGV